MDAILYYTTSRSRRLIPVAWLPRELWFHLFPLGVWLLYLGPSPRPPQPCPCPPRSLCVTPRSCWTSSPSRCPWRSLGLSCWRSRTRSLDCSPLRDQPYGRTGECGVEKYIITARIGLWLLLSRCSRVLRSPTQPSKVPLQLGSEVTHPASQRPTAARFRGHQP